MIDSLISILQQSKNRRIGGFFSGLGYVLVLFLSFLLGWHWLNEINRSELIIGGWITFGLCFLVLIRIIVGVLKSWKQKEVRVSYLYTVFLPLLLICEVSVGELLLGSSIFTAMHYNESAIGWFLGGMNGQRFSMLALLFCSVFPIVQLIRIIKSLPGVSTSRLLNVFAQYNLGYFFILAVSTIFQVILKSNLQNWVAEFKYFGFFQWILALAISVFMFTFPFIALREQYKLTGLKFTQLVWGILSVIVVFIVTNLIPSGLYNYGDSLIENASRIIAKEGMNRDSFEKARGLGLEQAYERYFNQIGYATDNTLFTKLFDATPEDYFKNKLKNIDSDGSMRGGTNETQIGKNAQVLLKLAEISNAVMQTGSESPILKTVISFHVDNLSDENQEFIVYFSAPSSHSIISDLKLGLHGEMQGIVAPRGAARRVYEEAIRTRRDPALLEKVGTNSYSLRVYPVLGKRDEKTLGKQLVQFTILTPISTDQKLITPMFSFINLKSDESTSLVYKKYENGGLVENKKFTQQETETALSQGQFISISQTGSNLCIPKTFLRQLMSIDNTNPSNVNDSSVDYDRVDLRDLLSNSGEMFNMNTIAIFLDNSLSVKRNKVNVLYPGIIKALSEGSGMLRDINLYSYNFVVEKIADVERLPYRGYTDNEAILDYIEKEGFQNQTIVIVTDDENFSLSDNENKSRNIASLKSNRIIILAIGDSTKRYNLDMMNIISASHGDIKMIQNTQHISGIVSTILTDEFTIPYCDSSATKFSPDTEKIIAGVVSSKLLGLVKNERDRLQIANLQELLAKKYGIINQFNPMIALETEQQKQDLDRYSNSEGKFNKVANDEMDFAGQTTNSLPAIDNSFSFASEGDMQIDYNDNGNANTEVGQDINEIRRDDIIRLDDMDNHDEMDNTFAKTTNSVAGISMAKNENYIREFYFSQSIVLALCIIYITLLYQIICTVYVFSRKGTIKEEVL